MSGWSGFTDDEVRQLKIENELIRGTENALKVSKVGQPPQRKKMKEKMVTMHKKQPINEEQSTKNLPNSQHSPIVTNNVNSADRSIENKQKALIPPTNSSSIVNSPIPPTAEVESPPLHREQTDKDNSAPTDSAAPIENTRGSPKVDDTGICVLSDNQEQELQITTLEQMQQKQQVMEDQNKKKQAMIKQTLQERFKQTQSESQRLKEIHKQLGLIDQSFQTDVDDLRYKIDEACLQFSHAQKRYNKAETEYVAAKLDFFHKKEVKDELTEQLYAIIEENEVKKARKLEELMSKLANDLTPTSSSSSTSPVKTEQNAKS